MRTEIKKLHQRLYATIVYVTHDQIEAMTLATRIAVMRAGELLQLGTPAQIYNRPANTFVAAFMGSPRMSLIPARLVPQGEGLALELQRGDQPKVSIPLPPQPPAVREFAGRAVIAGLRAEAISNGSRPASNGSGNGAQRRVVEGQVVVIEPTGPDTLVVLNIGGYELTARLEPDLDLRPGDRAEFKLDLTNLVLFDPSTEKLIA